MSGDKNSQDVRDLVGPEYHQNAHSAPGLPGNAQVEIRLARPDDADQLAHCFYRTYGDSYDHEWVYMPDEIRRKWSERVIVSIVGLAPNGEVIGHLAASFDRPQARVAEAGQAVVDPRYRGHHLFESMKKWLATWAGREGLYGLYSEATAAHPYSQRGNLALGANEMGFLIGYIPSSVQYKKISENANSRRKTAALMYLRTAAEPERIVYLPPAYRDIVMRVYENAGFSRIAGEGKEAYSNAGCVVHVHRDHDHNAALLRITKLGADAHMAIEVKLKALKADAVDCIYLDLPLAQPELVLISAALEDLGFVFSCILPEVRDDGDILRLQYLNGVDPHIEEISTASDFGRSLLMEIAEQLPTKPDNST